ncbi:putative ribonuclease H-like domain-containing protein [Tanacetum coccineum]
MALMAFSDSEVYNDKTCSKTCLKNYKTLKKQCDDLIVKLNQTEFIAATYKRGLATVEEQLITYRKNEVLFSEEVAVLKREVACKDYEINVLKSEFEKVKQEKEGIEFKIEKFDNASKSLNKLLENASKENSNDSLVKEQVSEDTSSFVKFSLNVEKETVFLDKKIEFVKAKNHEKPVKKSFRLIANTIKGKEWSMVPRAVLMKTGLKPFNTARTVNTAHPKSIVFSAKPMSRFSKSAQSTVKRPYQSKIVLTNKKFTQTNKTAKAKVVNTASPKAANTARPHSAVVNVVRDNQANVVKASTCWVWRPTKLDSASITLKKHNYIDARGRSKGYVTFGGGAHGGRISGKGTLKTDSLDFEDVYFVNELKFNLFSVSQMYDKKNYVLFTDTECLVLSPNFKLPDETHILLKIPRKDNMYSFDISDNGTEFKNKVIDDFCREKGIKREYSVARTPQQNGVAERRNRTQIVAARTMMLSNGEPKSAADDQKQVEDGPDNENDEKDKSEDDSSPKEVNTAGQHVNTASPEVNTGTQDKYVAEILKKFNYIDVKSASTPIDLEKHLVKDGDADDSLIFQVTPKTSHLLAIKRIFRYMEMQTNIRLSPCLREANLLSIWHQAKMEAMLIIKNVGDEAVHKELGDRIERAPQPRLAYKQEQGLYGPQELLEQIFFAIIGYRKKKWGMNENEGFRALFILKWNLEPRDLSTQVKDPTIQLEVMWEST